MRLTGLADALRQAVPVVEVDGWRTRGYEFDAKPKVVVGHHTAGPRSGEIPSLNILRDGRSDLPGPLCQVGLSRTGVAYVIASGKANHAGPGRWKDVTTSSLTVGIEVENTGVGESWGNVIDAFDKVAAVLLDLIDQPAQMYCGHREWALPKGRKIDPAGVDLDAQRKRIALLLQEGFDVALSAEDKAWIKEQIEASVDATIRGLMVHKLRSGDAVGTILRATDYRTARIVDMLKALGRGDGASAEQIANETVKKLAQALADEGA